MDIPPNTKYDIYFFHSKIVNKKIIVKEYESLLQLTGGDARKLLNTLEIVVSSFDTDNIVITNDSEGIREQFSQKS